jgi:hypothetical protein
MQRTNDLDAKSKEQEMRAEKNLKKQQEQNVALAAEVKRLEESINSTLFPYNSSYISISRSKPRTATQKTTQQRLDAEAAQVKQLNTQLAEAQANTEEALRNERQTISLLVSEKASLTEELERLNGIESRA